MDRFFLISQDEYEAFHALIEKRIGRSVDINRRRYLENKLYELMHIIGAKDLSTLYNRLKDSETYSKWWEALIKELTVNETYFFRNPMQMEALRAHILPQLIEKNKYSRNLRIWSAGCATGEEPYSIAMLLHEVLPEIAHWNIFILGTDLNRSNLDKAKEGIFRDWSFRVIQAYQKQRFFEHIDQDRFLLDNQIKRMVTFQYHNLMEDDYPSESNNTNNLDLILWRNMAIYFNQKINTTIGNRFYQCLSEGGVLLVGANETNDRLFAKYQSQVHKSATIYQKLIGIEKERISGRNGGQSDIEIKKAVKKKKKKKKKKKNDFLLKEELKQKSSISPEELADLLQSGIELKNKNELSDAMEQFQEIIKLAPGHIGAMLQISRIHANQGNASESARWIDKILDNDPLCEEAFLIRGSLSMELGQTENAIASFKKVLYLKPDFIMAHINLAMIFRETGKSEESRKHMNQAVRLLSAFPSENKVPGGDDLSGNQLLELIQSLP